MRLGILTRGFRSEMERSGAMKKISSGKGPICSAKECGDEPYLLAQKTKAHIWVGADRAKSGQLAVKEGIECLLLDDGMQHRRLERDIEIVVIDGSDPLSRGRFLPWGLLRDSPKRLQSADWIVATHVNDFEIYQQVQAVVAHLTSAPMIGTRIEVLNKEQFALLKVGIFCGIGQPAKFLQTVRDLKSEIVDTFILKDHGSLTISQLEKFAKKCRDRGAEALLCTEKDFVKLDRILLANACFPLSIIPVAIELKISFGKEHWDDLIKNILDKVEK